MVDIANLLDGVRVSVFGIKTDAWFYLITVFCLRAMLHNLVFFILCSIPVLQAA